MEQDQSQGMLLAHSSKWAPAGKTRSSLILLRRTNKGQQSSTSLRSGPIRAQWAKANKAPQKRLALKYKDKNWRRIVLPHLRALHPPLQNRALPESFVTKGRPINLIMKRKNKNCLKRRARVDRSKGRSKLSSMKTIASWRKPLSK